MLIKIIAVGRIKDRNLSALCEMMLKRLRFDVKIEIVELKDSDKTGECKRIAEALDKEQGFVIALSEDGKLLDSVAFATRIDSIHQRIVFVIGGPQGLDDTVKNRVDLLLSLSPMTFTHEMARYLLLEQIFRAVTIIKGRGYHNG